MLVKNLLQSEKEPYNTHLIFNILQHIYFSDAVALSLAATTTQIKCKRSGYDINGIISMEGIPYLSFPIESSPPKVQ